MRRWIFLGNAAATIPFALVGLVAPVAAFQGFGVALDDGGALVARGYAATCLGYGAIFAALRDVADARAQTALLVGSLLFNAAEVAVQAPAAVSGIASGPVWATIGVHALLALGTLAALLRRA